MVVLLSLLGCPNEIGLNDSVKAPSVTLVTPVDGGVFDPAQPVQVCAAVDFEGELDSLRITLASDVDGVLATEGFGACPGGDLGIAVSLSPVVHTLSLTVTDAISRGGSDTAQLTPTGNGAPTCSIVAPATGAVYAEGSIVTVTARIDDSNGGDVGVVLTSTLDGELGSQTVNANSNVEFMVEPSEGSHDLVVTATDDRGLGGLCVVSIEVQECQDLDGDGFQNCEGDCDDTDPDDFPGALETADGRDNDCDGTIDEGTVLFDDDGDGTNELDGDCDDSNVNVNPSATDIPDDGVDQDCNGTDTVTCHVDADDDGYGVAATLLATDGDCFDPFEAPVAGDCDDTQASINPGAAEIPADGIDQDCNGADPAGCFADTDGDGFGSATVLPAGDGDCEDPGESSFGNDCNDGVASIYPGATEILDDGVDQDCSGVDSVTCYVDGDGDGYGRATVQAEEGTCSVGADVDGDCNDAAFGINPGATDVPGNGVDEDCNGVDARTCFQDADLDGYGVNVNVVAPDGTCNTNQGESTNADDCDDTNQGINPGAGDIPNDGIDQDCDGSDAVGTGVCNQAQLSPGDVIITEVMMDPDSPLSDNDAEWFELYNTTSSPIVMCGDWDFRDDGQDNFDINNEESLVIPSHGYLVLVRSGDLAANGGVVGVRNFGGGMGLSNNDDEIEVLHNGVLIDRITWSIGVRGESKELGLAHYTGTGNDTNGNWCWATTTYGPTSNTGTPGAPPSCTP